MLFADTPELWRDSQDSGIRHRWSQSSFNANGVAGMLSLSRSGDPVTRKERSDKEPRMRWLVALTHLSISRLHPHSQDGETARLTPREIEALKWMADGKSEQAMADILMISKHLVDFHLKNAIQKLQSSNKTAAVARAAALGLLN